MTENERFTWKNVYGWHTGAFLVVMNGLDAKNKRLKQENEQLTQDKIEMFIRERDTENELRDIKKENEQLKIQLQNTSAQRDEFYHGARENANRVGKLEKENEQLKSVNMEMEDCLGRLEESNINLRIKLKKIRDYAKEDGEVKQGIIEKVILE